ncbi:LOW QUALITY PROTEIN: histone PARylation factor 1-like [Oncorhynchus tshawytscha]|uniref:LOW QUALITY PROTEIN: histone PARylation factor 1-like n=1 Tax=Oncorhynchus tshawytscha TaxID=74940 RepID=UPI001C3E1491|nr:LOW QUALITY PROTEIN: histone PARylation factor 1-like [Oncorhynchus tshawytscha]
MTGKRKTKSTPQESDSADGQKKCRPEEPTARPTTAEVPTRLREEVERLYKLTMPEDFYLFWDFCSLLSPDNPRALKEILGLRLVGPFDILAEAHSSATPGPNYHLHWTHDPQPDPWETGLQLHVTTALHMGYYRDSPDSLPVFLGENEAKKGCTITQMGDNMFAAVHLFLGRKRKERGGRKEGGKALDNLEEELRERAESLGFSLEQKTKGMKQRDKKVVTKTFHGAGLVVPVDQNDVGYRELPETDASMKRLCKAIAEARCDEDRMKAFGPLQEMITFVQFANDECDYGMGLELGIDLFCYGSQYFYKVIRQLLPMAYSLLKRGLFGEILEAHLSSRSHDNLDQLTSA